MLGAAHLADLAEIDALAEAQMAAAGAQPKADAGRQPQQRRHAVLRQAHLHLGMEMQADGECLAAGAGEPVLAPEILAIGREIEPAPMREREALGVAVGAGVEPDLAPGLLAVGCDPLRPPA